MSCNRHLWCYEPCAFLYIVEIHDSKPKHSQFPVTSLTTFAAIRMQIYILQFYFICASFCLYFEGQTIQQPFKSCLASLRQELYTICMGGWTYSFCILKSYSQKDLKGGKPNNFLPPKSILKVHAAAYFKLFIEFVLYPQARHIVFFAIKRKPNAISFLSVPLYNSAPICTEYSPPLRHR